MPFTRKSKTPPSVPASTIRLGGMALQNGVLIQSPHAWGAAVRLDDGTIKFASGDKALHHQPRIPFLRGPIKFFESLTFFGSLKRALPEARLPFVSRAGLSSLFLTVRAMQRLETGKDSLKKDILTQLLTPLPALVTLAQGETAAYHGAEHITIGRYENKGPATREHKRCGSTLVAPLMVGQAVSNIIAHRLPRAWQKPVRAGGSLFALGAALEALAWAGRHPDHPLAEALDKPGYFIQHNLGTREPSPEQLEVAGKALDACLNAELKYLLTD